ncbi:MULTISPECIES: hypothetical protein [Campylobacter]|uniref:hypothetical protein n=1 Tax=Campylobacter TaxID=194 RepID=UPI000F802588|nr:MULTISPECIES: hypothetical protein [Campylobacter]HEC1776202.1 hypothetical protein [Campylobacter lari]MCV3531137.1 hypothetical protein [Campylobacter sp. CNRCH_2007_0968H]MCW1341478.1 hypothetical protein [Campylobacter jejuni]RTI81567.1 hypothetical protein C3I08_05290 [Campylobacter jejuni]RTJ00256.1 hypothetical protein C3I01_05345 [Campylobacter jejuni]
MNFLTDSIIIYSEKEVDVTIHINIFISDIDEECYFELGLLTSGDKDLKEISIFLPIEYNLNSRVEDLYEKFEQNDNYIKLIFNENTSINGYDTFKITKGTIRFCKIKKIDRDKITLNIQQTGDGCKNYFRFRIKNIDKKLLRVEEPASSLIIDPFKRTIRVLGFHINNARNYKKKKPVLEGNKIKIKEINSFLICDIKTELIESSVEKKSFRLLEDDEWNNYIVGHKDNKKKIVYQFKKTCKDDENIGDYKLFIKTYNINSKNFLYGILFITFILGMALLANAIFLEFNENGRRMIILSGVVIFCVFILKHVLNYCISIFKK